MDKRILATLCVTIFMLATLATVPQASAHYTLGNQDWKPNLTGGLIGETNITLGALSGGLPTYNTYAETHVADGLVSGHQPGHIAFATPGRLYVPPSDQVNYYSPEGAVITETTGDIYFYICISDDTEAQGGPIDISWRAQTSAFAPPQSLFELSKYLYIAIPPEFTPPVDWTAGWGDALTTNQGMGDTSNVWTTITNDHKMIQTGKFGPRHPVAPNWWFVRITAEPRDAQGVITEADLETQYPDLDFNPKYLNDATIKGSSGFLYPPNMDPWLDRQIRTGAFAGCYHLGIFGMKAPTCAGKYFFKIFYTSTEEPTSLLTMNGWPAIWQAPNPPAPYTDVFNHDPLSGYLNGWFEKYDTFFPENYPVLLVKGEVDPGYISGTVRYCGHSQYYYGYYYGSGVHTSGKVFAEGTALDPVTNEPTGRPVCGVGYFLGELPGQGEDWKDRQMGSEGYYEIEGLAAGIYTLTAYAAGFVPRTLATQITVKRGQSIHGVDIYTCPTAKLQTKVYSKCPTGPTEFPEYVTMDQFPASLTILPVVPGGADVRGDTPVMVPKDGLAYWGSEGATTVQGKDGWAEYEETGIVPAEPTLDKYGWAWQELVDAEGTAVAWNDFTFDITAATGDTRSFGTFWGDPSCYSGIETMWDGHVPTFLADFTSGIVPGSFRVRTYVFGYVQTKEYIVDFPAVEFPGTAYMEMDIFKGGTITTTVHYHLQELPSAEVPRPDGPQLIIEAYDANGVLQAWNMTGDGITTDSNGDGVADILGTTLTLIGDSKAWTLDGRVHGMPEGTYTIKAHQCGYLQQEFPQHTIQYCTSGSLSFHLIQGAIIKTTIYSRDCQDPSQPREWQHPGENIEMEMISEGKSVPDWHLMAWTEQVAGATDTGVLSTNGGTGLLVDYFRAGMTGTGIPTGIYSITARTPGYVQLQWPEVWAQKGTSTGDIPVYLLVGPEIRVVVDFKTELIPAPLPSSVYSINFRIQAFDEDGILAAANITSVPVATIKTYSQYPWPGDLNPAQPAGVTSWVFQLHGFSTFTTPVNKPSHGYPATAPYLGGGTTYWQFRGYNDMGPKTLFQFNWGPGDWEGYGIMWGKTYTIVVSDEITFVYVQLATVTATPTCAGITTVIFEMDQSAVVSGTVYTRNWMGDFRKASWTQNTATSAAGTFKATGPTDGWYGIFFVKPDTYTVTSESPGYTSASRTVVTTWGGASSGIDFYLEESGVPIPEFPAAGILALVSALAASLYLLRWRRQTEIPVR